jgi:aldose 1-epimerase
VPPPASGRQILLAAGGWRAVVTEVGASLRALSRDGSDVLDGYGSHEAALDARGQALVPWPNRLADGRYEFSGTEHQLPLTEPDKHNAIHGFGRFARWQIEEQEEQRALLRLDVPPQPGYPFALQVTVEYRLDASTGITVTSTARNVGARPLPYGAGFHPYLTVGTQSIDDAQLHLTAGVRLETDERGIPTGQRVPVEGTAYDFSKPRTIGDTKLDTTFGELARDDHGRAFIRLSSTRDGRSAALWLDDAHPYVMAFTGDTLPDPERRRRSLGLEPMTCAPNAFQTGEGLKTLQPGAEFAGAWGICS